jgi:hypothetical protein
MGDSGISQLVDGIVASMSEKHHHDYKYGYAALIQGLEIQVALHGCPWFFSDGKLQT